jgi:hypothetical protein
MIVANLTRPGLQTELRPRLRPLYSIRCHPERSEGSASGFSTSSFPLNFKLSTVHRLFDSFLFNFKLSTVNFLSLSPFAATLTDSSQLIENPATLSPAFATLTSRVKHKSFVCHSYKKHRGWGRGSPTRLLPKVVIPRESRDLLFRSGPRNTGHSTFYTPLKPLPHMAHPYQCTCKKGPAARDTRYSPCAAS